MTDGAVVPLRGPEPSEPGSSPAEPCPVCGRPGAAEHQVPPHARPEPSTSPRLPDGLATVLARTGQVSRRARAERAAEHTRVAQLAGYLHEQVAQFLVAMEQAGARPTVPVRVSPGRGARLPRSTTLPTWPIRHWRSGGRVVGEVPRTRHLYVGADGSLYESHDDPGLAAARDSMPQAEPVDLAPLLVSMGELDALRSSEWVIAGLADLMKEHGAAL